MNQVLNKIPKKERYSCDFNHYPNKYVFYRLPEEKTNLFYGIELELSSPNRFWYENISFINTNFIFTSYDGSIHSFGMEFKNHPASFRFLKKNFIQWYHIFRQKDLVAHESCGIHIHLSKAAFDREILFRFIKFIYDNKKFSFNISGRDRSHFNRWCNIECKKDSNYLKKTNFIFSDYGVGGSKSQAITVNMNGETVEVRIFASTKNPLLFWKNLEFCDCLYYFCVYVSSNEDLTIRNFINFLSFKKNRYKNLYKFIMANFCSEITGMLKLPDYRQEVLSSV